MKNNVGCLLVHGFGGQVGEVKFLADYLSDLGYDVVCPSLSGHSGNKKDLVGIKYIDWIKSAEIELLKLRERNPKVIIAGFSMGGLIAINLCEKYSIDGLVTLNTPIYYWDLRNIFKNIAGDFKARKFTNIKRYMSSGSKYPFSAMLNFRRLLNITKPLLGNVKCPILICQAIDDDTVKSISAQYIYAYTKSEHKDVRYYNNAGHGILQSPVAQEVSEDVEKFLRKMIENE